MRHINNDRPTLAASRQKGQPALLTMWITAGRSLQSTLAGKISLMCRRGKRRATKSGRGQRQHIECDLLPALARKCIEAEGTSPRRRALHHSLESGRAEQPGVDLHRYEYAPLELVISDNSSSTLEGGRASQIL